jgi:uncharacterized protein
MKYLVIILVVVVVLWLLSRSRSRAQVSEGKPASQRNETAAIEDMVTCAYCQVHLPKSEALPGRGGYFCDAAHRTAHEAKEVSR